jgi:hypothetical protein
MARQVALNSRGARLDRHTVTRRPYQLAEAADIRGHLSAHPPYACHTSVPSSSADVYLKIGPDRRPRHNLGQHPTRS